MAETRNIVPWVDELQSYLNGKLGLGKIHKIMSNADFASLSDADEQKLTVMFDYNRKISKDLLKRQFDLYFKLLSKQNDDHLVVIPVFSNYVDWFYSQDMDRLTDETFDIILKEIVKSPVPLKLTSAMESFIGRLPRQYEKGIDTLSNPRLKTLIEVLKYTGNSYDKMPDECKEFIKNLFIVCAVKFEIENNNLHLRKIFGGAYSDYFSAINKAFANVDLYDNWISGMTDILTSGRLTEYANYQEAMINAARRSHDPEDIYNIGQNKRKELGIRSLADYDDKRSSPFHDDYLDRSRNYHAIANSMAEMFASMINSEVQSLAESRAYGKEEGVGEVSLFAVTNNMQDDLIKTKNENAGNENELLRGIAYWLIKLVHLDDILGKKPEEIYDADATDTTFARIKEELDKNNLEVSIRVREFPETFTEDDLEDLADAYAEDPDDLELASMYHDMLVRDFELSDDGEFVEVPADDDAKAAEPEETLPASEVATPENSVHILSDEEAVMQAYYESLPNGTQLSLFGPEEFAKEKEPVRPIDYIRQFDKELWARARNGECTVDDLDELYELWDKNPSTDLAALIMDLEDQAEAAKKD